MFQINQNSPIYDPESVQPMRDELVYAGFEELLTAESVDDKLSKLDDKVRLVVINSVCGCAAGSARPGATEALQNKIIPDESLTVFAGQDKDAVAAARNNYLGQFPPSSPCMALIKNGEVQFFLPRHHIEGRSADEVAEILTAVFEEHCTNAGPSISPEAYKELVHAKECGSKIPLNKN
ncbi:MAG: BrxA/BrxB family bacilliredoxin [Bacteroidetes bacterium]|nr:BrxA/BrxB family bacilliredoxin [Bacteroidota bacterium]